MLNDDDAGVNQKPKDDTQQVRRTHTLSFTFIVYISVVVYYQNEEWWTRSQVPRQPFMYASLCIGTCVGGREKARCRRHRSLRWRIWPSASTARDILKLMY
jgi:hypothetical protein